MFVVADSRPCAVGFGMRGHRPFALPGPPTAPEGLFIPRSNILEWKSDELALGNKVKLLEVW